MDMPHHLPSLGLVYQSTLYIKVYPRRIPPFQTHLCIGCSCRDGLVGQLVCCGDVVGQRLQQLRGQPLTQPLYPRHLSSQLHTRHTQPQHITASAHFSRKQPLKVRCVGATDTQARKSLQQMQHVPASVQAHKLQPDTVLPATSSQLAC